MKQIFITLCLFTSFLAAGCSNAGDSSTGGGGAAPQAANPVQAEVVPGIPAKNTVTLVDLGAKTCIPCKMMAPILEELKKEYQGRAEVIFIDVWEKPQQAKSFSVSAIPTQVLYDQSGKEVFRHVGFMDKKALIEQLDKTLAVK